MKKRLKKKKYRKYVNYVLSDASVSPYYRKKFREAEAFEMIVLDVTDPALFPEDTVTACRRYGLVYCGYRTEFTDLEKLTCLIVVLPDNTQLGGIFDVSFDQLLL